MNTTIQDIGVRVGDASQGVQVTGIGGTVGKVTVVPNLDPAQPSTIRVDPVGVVAPTKPELPPNATQPQLNAYQAQLNVFNQQQADYDRAVQALEPVRARLDALNADLTKDGVRASSLTVDNFGNVTAAVEPIPKPKPPPP